MMQTTRARRLERLAQRHAAAMPTHVVWLDIGESDEAESGRASEGDPLLITGWGAPKDRATNRGPAAPFESKP